MRGKWTYDERWDTWRFWRDEDGQNVIKVQRSNTHGLIASKLYGAGVTDEQLKEITFPISDDLFRLSDAGIYSYEISQ